MNINALRANRNWLILAAAVPVAGYLIYRSLTPAQKKKFKKSLSDGSLSMASAFITRLIDNYKKKGGSALSAGGAESRLTRMARIPNRNESETTIGDERW
jgi:hypothetical protein